MVIAGLWAGLEERWLLFRWNTHVQGNKLVCINLLYTGNHAEQNWMSVQYRDCIKSLEWQFNFAKFTHCLWFDWQAAHHYNPCEWSSGGYIEIILSVCLSVCLSIRPSVQILVWPITFFLVWHWLIIFGSWVYHHETMCRVPMLTFDLKVRFIGFCHVYMSDL